ncbi:MAG: sulfite exporter TauE/SafE [Crocinitomicaceae bacterium]|jgi:sulfite exporter TauE/SafE
MNPLIITGFLLGITSSLHCIGMCGPIAMAIPVDRSNNRRILFGALQYNFGRIIIYSILGGIVGTMGLTLNTFGILQWLSIFAGVFLIFYAWRKHLKNAFFKRLPSFNFQFGLNKMLGKIIKSKSPLKLLFLGGLNGLLPCGMVFAALLNALLTGEILLSALAMAAFGLGTLPAMLAVTFASNKIGSSLRAKLKRVAPVLITLVGVLIILRGMNLNIPYISPEVKIMEQTDKSAKPEVQMECCHTEENCESN